MKLWKNLIAAALLGACAQAWADPILSFDTNGGQATLGSVQDYAVNIADASDLYTYQFSINYDARYLRALGVTEGGFLATGGGTLGGTGFIDDGAGTISFIYNTLYGGGPGVSGSGLLASIRFEAIGVGNAALSFTDVLLLGSSGDEFAFDAASAQIAVVSGVAEVPEPASMLLIGAGLAGVAALRRRGVAARV